MQIEYVLQRVSAERQKQHMKISMKLGYSITFSFLKALYSGQHSQKIRDISWTLDYGAFLSKNDVFSETE